MTRRGRADAGLQWVVAEYDVERDGGEVGAHTLKRPDGRPFMVPAGSAILFHAVNTVEEMASAGAATIAIAVGAVTFVSAPFDEGALLPDSADLWAGADANRFADAAPVTATVADADLTAGRVQVHIGLLHMS
jgi:hypothetical protein